MYLLPAEGRDDAESVVVVKAHTAPREFMPRVEPERILFLVRHPLDAIWAEYQRRRLHSHSASINLTKTSDSSFSLASTIGMDFPRFASCMACKWLQLTAFHAQLSSMEGTKIHVIRYEDIKKDTSGL